jgi:hypothetical protein
MKTIQLPNLLSLQNYLVNVGQKPVFKEADDIQNYERLEVRISTQINGENKYWPIEFAFMPGLETSLPGFCVLQCFVPVTASVPHRFTTVLSEMCNLINSKLVLGGFGFLNNFQLLYFKHNLIFSTTNFETQLIIINEVIDLISYFIISFYEAFNNVILEKMNMKEAFKAMPLHKLYENDVM